MCIPAKESLKARVCYNSTLLDLTSLLKLLKLDR